MRPRDRNIAMRAASEIVALVRAHRLELPAGLWTQIEAIAIEARAAVNSGRERERPRRCRQHPGAGPSTQEVPDE